MTPDLASSFGLKTLTGVVIASVVPDGPGDKAGLQPGDVLMSINGEPIVDAREAMADIAEISPGTQLPITIVRDGEKREITLTAGERPEASESEVQ